MEPDRQIESMKDAELRANVYLAKWMAVPEVQAILTRPVSKDGISIEPSDPTT